MRIFLPALLAILFTTQAFSQRRSELIETVNMLNGTVDSLETELVTTQRELRTAETKANTIAEQNEQLKQTNEGLLENLNKFIMASTEKTSNISRTLETLQKREAQLKQINDSFSTHDSISYLVLTDLKRTLGEDAQIGVEGGAVMIILNNTTSFTTASNQLGMSDNAKDFMNRLAATINKYDTLAVTVESISNKSWANAANKAAVVADHLINVNTVGPDRIEAIGKMAEADVTYIKLHPRFDHYYLWLREEIKKGR